MNLFKLFKTSRLLKQETSGIDGLSKALEDQKTYKESVAAQISFLDQEILKLTGHKAALEKAQSNSDHRISKLQDLLYPSGSEDLCKKD